MSKGKFIESTIYDAKGRKINGVVEEKDFTDAIENSYFFGQFMAYYMSLKLVKTVGAEQTVAFMDKKFLELGKGNPSFLIQAEKLEESVMQYYRDTMENNDTHVKKD